MKTKFNSFLDAIATLALVWLLAFAFMSFKAKAADESSWIGFVQGVVTNKTLTVTAYPSYAPDLTINGEKKSWGFGVAALYPLGDYAFTGARLDYLGDQYWSPSVTVGCKADVQLFGHNFTPFALGGAIIPLGGAGSDNHSVGAIVGGGIYTTVWQSADKKTSVQAYYAAEHWTIFSGVVHHPGVALTFKF